VSGGQVDPELDHLEPATAAGELRAVELVVHDAGGRGHPLHVAGADPAAASRRVPMLHLAGVDEGDRLEAPMRMLPHAQPLLRRRKAVGTGVVEQQEGVDRAPHVRVGEQGSHGEPIAHPVAVRIPHDGEKLPRRHLPWPSWLRSGTNGSTVQPTLHSNVEERKLDPAKTPFAIVEQSRKGMLA
jgi:hypothetical protein